MSLPSSAGMPGASTGSVSKSVPAVAPAALAAFLRGVERRGAVLAELQCGDADRGDAALARAMQQFRGEARTLPMGQWPQRFWAVLLADHGLRQHAPVALQLGPTDRLAELGSGPRAALLLRLAAGLEEADAAAVLGVAEPSYRLALQRALPHHPDGRADPHAWQRLGEHVHRRIKTLPPPRLVRLSRTREAALKGVPIAGPGPAIDRARSRPRWLLPLLWALLAMCVLALAATFRDDIAQRLDGPDAGRVGQRALSPEAPAARYRPDAGLVAHRDFELLADPQALSRSDQLGFHSWLAAQGASAPVAGAEPRPTTDGDASTAAMADVEADIDAAQPISETAHEPR